MGRKREAVERVEVAELLTKEQIRADLLKNGNVKSTQIIIVLICLPLAAVAFLLGASLGDTALLGCVFALVPVLACTVILLDANKIRKNWKQIAGEFESGHYTLRVSRISRMLENTTRDKDGNDWTVYKIFFPRENGEEEWSFRVNQTEFEEAHRGDKYFLVIIKGEAAAYYPRGRYKLSPELDFKLRIDEEQEQEYI